MSRAPARATAWMTPDGLSAADQMALDELAENWAGYYDLGHADGEFHAFRLIGGPLITAGTLAGLESAVRADYARAFRAPQQQGGPPW